MKNYTKKKRAVKRWRKVNGLIAASPLLIPNFGFLYIIIRAII